MSLPDFSMRPTARSPAPISATSPIAGTRRWRRTSSAPATTSTSSTSPRRCRCCTARSGGERHGGQGRPRAVRRHQAPGAGAIAEAAKRSAQYYVNSRWLGGMLTNWKTISGSIQRLRKLDEMLAAGGQGLHQERAPDADARARQARARARRHQGHGRHARPDLRHRHQQGSSWRSRRRSRLGIPVAAIVDTNCDPDGITYPVPANDDAGRAIPLYCDLIARAAIDGISRGQGAHGHRRRRIRGPGPDEPARRSRRSRLKLRPRPSSCSPRPRGAPDDLAKLPGVGPQIEKKLNEPASSTTGRSPP